MLILLYDSHFGVRIERDHKLRNDCGLIASMFVIERHPDGAPFKIDVQCKFTDLSLFRLSIKDLHETGNIVNIPF